ncbi:MAG: PEP-CTERM sorting domain-containing protein [Limisphaerales bacterium]
MCWGDTVDVGYLFLQQDDGLGTVTFNIFNAAGPGGYAPDFPVLDNLDFTGVELTVFCANAQCSTDLGASSAVFSLGTIAAGGFDDSVSFSSADLFSKAVFTAGLDLTSLSLDDGMGGTTSFTGSTSTTLEWMPTGGSGLIPYDLVADNADFDVGVVVDAPGTSSVPEPATFSLLALGIGSLLLRRNRSAKASASPSASTLRHHV